MLEFGTNQQTRQVGSGMCGRHDIGDHPRPADEGIVREAALLRCFQPSHKRFLMPGPRLRW